MGCMFATSFIVWLHTETKEPSKRRLADTIYNTLHQSMHLLAVDTVVAVGLALTWMYLLRSFVKPLIYVSLVVVPMMLVGLSIYPFVMSFKTGDKGYGAQDRVMRWGSVVPAIMAVTWVYAAWTSKQALHRAVGIIQLSCKILGDNPALVLMSFGTLIATCAFTWIWVMMFTRAFLTGNVLVRGESNSPSCETYTNVPADKWIWTLSSKTVALGIYYIIMYLWTLGVASGIHRYAPPPFPRSSTDAPQLHLCRLCLTMVLLPPRHPHPHIQSHHQRRPHPLHNHHLWLHLLPRLRRPPRPPSPLHRPPPHYRPHPPPLLPIHLLPRCRPNQPSNTLLRRNPLTTPHHLLPCHY